MSLDEIGKVVLGVLAGLGGISGIIIITIKFSCNMIAKRLEEKYTLKLNKELETYKSSLDNKNYISKTKFDTEFNIYRELSKAYAEMVKNITSMIPNGITKCIADEEAKENFENELYEKALCSTVTAQDVLNQNIPFISNDLVEKYENILNLCGLQLDAFERRWDVSIIDTQKNKKEFSKSDYERTTQIRKEFKNLNEDVRSYLSKLDVLD